MEEKREDYRNRWQKENQDRIIVMVSKGQKEEIKAHAESLGMSLNAYINKLIDSDMQQSSRGELK